MYRAIILMACVRTFVMADLPDAEKCLTLIESESKCCEMFPLKSNASEIIASQDDNEDKFKECMDLPQNCAREICIAQNLGIATSYGTMDKKLAQAYIETEFGLILNADLVKKMIENCINGDISAYGPDTMCDLLKFDHCTDMQLLLSCTKWLDDSSCAEIKKLVDECKKIFT